MGTKTALFSRRQSGGMFSIYDETQTTGDIYWVCSTTGTDAAGGGQNPDAPLATLDYAVGLCTASKGDKIIVMPGHAETLTTAVTVDIAGIKIVGLGNGTNRPAFTVNAAIDGITVTAANVTIENLLFNEMTNASATSHINIGAASCIIRGCHFDLGTNDQESITVEAAANDLKITDNEWVVTADGPDAAIEIEGTAARTLILDNLFICSDGTNAFDAAAINTGQANTNMLIKGNRFVGAGVSSTAISAATAVDKTVVSNFYGSGALNVDEDKFSGDVNVYPTVGAPTVVDDRVWYVDSVNGSASHEGHSPQTALATIAAAVTASAHGDTIVVASGHAETLTAKITVNKSVTIVGSGVGTRRPSLTSNVADDTITVTAADVTLQNLLFNEATAVTGGAINVGAANCIIRDCHFDVGANDLEAITVPDAGDDLTIEGCKFVVTANGPDAAIEIESANTTRTTIRNNVFICSDGTNAFDAAAINSTVANTNMLVTGNTFLGAGAVASAVIAATAVDKTVSGNTYGSDAINVDQEADTDQVTWYVDSVNGSANFDGLSPRKALVTLAAAEAAASAGDTIIVARGHSETLAAKLVVNLAGLSIIGQGTGTRRPQITGNVADDTISLAAANILIENLYFNEATSVTGAAIDVAGARCEIRGCHFDLGGNDLECITVPDAGDYLTVEDCTFSVTADGPDAAIEIESANVIGPYVLNNKFHCSDGTNAFDAAAINSTVANTAMLIKGNVFMGGGVAATAVIAATAVDKTIVGNFYGGGAVSVDEDTLNEGTYIDGTNPFGTTWYVATSGGSDSFSGKSPKAAKATIAATITAASAGDVVVLGPGTHSIDVSSAAMTPKADMQFVAAIPPRGGKPSTIITHDADDGADLCLIDVDGVVFNGIEFLMVAGGTTAIRTMSVSQTTAATGLVFEDCWFNQNSVDAAGVISVAMNDATNATTGAVFKNCRFIGADATTNQAIHLDIGVGGAPDLLVEDCVFVCESADGDALAINFADPGAAGGSYGATIRNNDIIGPKDGGADVVPIVLAAGMTEDEIVGIIRTNYFSNCSATPITQDEINGSIVWNYVGDDATGGTLVDPGT